MNKISKKYINSLTKGYKSSISAAKESLKILNERIDADINSINSLIGLTNFLGQYHTQINICSAIKMSYFGLNKLSMYLPKSSLTLKNFVQNNSMNINVNDNIIFYSDSKLPNYEYTKDIIWLFDSTFTSMVDYECTPLPLLYNGIYLIEYTIIKGPDNKEYKVFLLNKNKIEMQPIVSAYYISPDNAHMKRVRNSIAKFVKKLLPSCSEEKLLLEVNNMIHFFTVNTMHDIIMYNFNESLYNDCIIDSELRKKIKLFIIELQNLKLDSKHLYFINSSALPISNIFS